MLSIKKLEYVLLQTATIPFVVGKRQCFVFEQSLVNLFNDE